MEGEKFLQDSRIGAEPFVHYETWDWWMIIVYKSLPNSGLGALYACVTGARSPRCGIGVLPMAFGPDADS